MSYYTILEDMIGPRSRVYVVSDSEYKELQQKQAKNEIRDLEDELKVHRRLCERLETRIADIQTEHGLLPEAKV